MPEQQPMILYTHVGGPNPWKVAIILEELEIPYEQKFVDFADVKKEPYISLNPNGRLPALEDKSQNITLWESGAIIDYLIENYDKDAKLHYTTSPEKYLSRSWAHFQMSGQGPYFGQLIWFKNYHNEKLQSCIDRYANEIRRVTGVLDAHLTKHNTEYLVGDKLTYADLMFVTWAVHIENVAGQELNLREFAAYSAWMERLTNRPKVAKLLKQREEMMATGH